MRRTSGDTRGGDLGVDGSIVDVAAMIENLLLKLIENQLLLIGLHTLTDLA